MAQFSIECDPLPIEKEYQTIDALGAIFAIFQYWHFDIFNTPEHFYILDNFSAWKNLTLCTILPILTMP